MFVQGWIGRIVDPDIIKKERERDSLTFRGPCIVIYSYDKTN